MMEIVARRLTELMVLLCTITVAAPSHVALGAGSSCSTRLAAFRDRFRDIFRACWSSDDITSAADWLALYRIRLHQPTW